MLRENVNCQSHKDKPTKNWFVMNLDFPCAIAFVNFIT